MSQGVYLTQMDRIDKYEHKKVYFLSSFLKKQSLQLHMLHSHRQYKRWMLVL